MARVTVEDCVDKVPNRFELVLLAAHRARSIANGSQVTVDPDNDKNPVIALREIADTTIPPDDLREGLIHSTAARRWAATISRATRWSMSSPRSSCCAAWRA